MKKFGKTLRRFWANEEGLETVEYAVIAGLLVLAVIGAILLLGDAVDQKFDDVTDAVSGAGGP